MKKILIVTSVASMILQFNISNIKILKELNYEVYIFSNFKTGNTVSNEKIDFLKNLLSELRVNFYHSNIYRNPFNPLNLFSFFYLLFLVKRLKVDVIHSQSPVGGIFGRLVSIFFNIKSIYTAHGFHFFKGSSFLTWLFYFPIEKFLSRFTNDLIVMNNEDFMIASKKFYQNRITYIPGIGIKNKDFLKKRFINNSLNDPLIIVSVGELISRKNHLQSIDIVSKLKFNFIFYILGKGKLFSKLNSKIIKLNLNNKVQLIGYTPNVREYLKKADIFLFTSKQEGLPISLLEAMDEGNICVASNIRGNKDIVTDNFDGFLIEKDQISKYVEIINLIHKGRFNLNEISLNAQTKAISFKTENIYLKMKEIYTKYLN